MRVVLSRSVSPTTPSSLKKTKPKNQKTKQKEKQTKKRTKKKKKKNSKKKKKKKKQTKKKQQLRYGPFHVNLYIKNLSICKGATKVSLQCTYNLCAHTK